MSRKLRIGGTQRVAGWEVLNALPGPHVDHLGDVRDLSQFADGTFSDIYASHMMQHLDYVNELLATLQECHRILEPGGKFYVSVPDLETLARLFLEKDKHDFSDRFLLMRMMFGGHMDKFDYHLVGLDQDSLVQFLFTAGFRSLRRATVFGLFQDTSMLTFKGTLISLNIIAEKALEQAGGAQASDGIKASA